MSDKIEQKNVFGHNMVNSLKDVVIKQKTGFIYGVITGVVASIIFEIVVRPLL